MRIRRRRPRVLLDERGFADIYQRHAGALIAYFARRVYEPEVAFDLTAETFAQALLSRHRFRGTSDAEIGAWLHGIAHHQLTRYFRRGAAERRALARLNVERPELSQEEHDRIEQLAGLAELRKDMAEALRGLSTDQREALKLRVVEELPYGDVAERLGITETAARARVSRGLRALAARLDSGAVVDEAKETT